MDIRNCEKFAEYRKSLSVFRNSFGLSDVRGFSLIEIIIFISLFAVVVLGVTELTLSQVNAWARARIERTATEGTAQILERMASEVLLAQGVVSSSSKFDVSPGRLALASFTNAASDATTTVTLLLSGGEMNIGRLGIGTTTLNATTTLIVTSTIFTQLVTSTSVGIRIQVTGEARRGQYVADKTLATTVIIRRKY